MKSITPKFAVYVENGKIVKAGHHTHGLASFVQYVSQLPNGWFYLAIHPETKDRSLRQNAYYWGVIITMLYENIGWFATFEEYHDYCKAQFNGKLYTLPLNHAETGKPLLNENGEVIKVEVIVPQSTAALSTVGFEDYQAKIRTWASIHHQLYIPLPNEATPKEVVEDDIKFA